MPDPQIYTVQAADVRTDLTDMLNIVGAVRVLAAAANNLADQITARIDDMLARVNVELN